MKMFSGKSPCAGVRRAFLAALASAAAGVWPGVSRAANQADGRPVFSTRVEFDVIAPIGSYDPDKDINQGANFASLNPYWAMTVLPLAHLELSVRFNYLYNFKNWRPALGRYYSLARAPPVRSAQAGQAGWANFAASYEIIHGLHAGINGYYFQQFNLDLYEMQDGLSNPGTGFGDSGLASILAVGPGALRRRDGNGDGQYWLHGSPQMS